MKAIVAPNAFKGSLDTFAVAEAICEGLQAGGIGDCVPFPIADGGEGFRDILVKQLAGSIEPVMVNDPLGRKIESGYGIVSDNTVVIELAQASGLKFLSPDEYNPLVVDTFGTGELLVAAMDKGFRRFVFGIGNSATVDGGLGLLRAIGLKVLDEEGREIVRPGDLQKAVSVDDASLEVRLKECAFTVACDVDHTLLGLQGAAAVFGPQKGADTAMVRVLDDCLAQWNFLVKTATGCDMAAHKHSGAAGGIGAALMAFAGANLVPGINLLADLTGFTDVLNDADVLITAEGRVDEQTLGNKGPYGVAMMAKKKGLAVVALAGQIPPSLDLSLFEYFDAVLPIAAGPVTLEEAIGGTRSNLVRTASQVAKLLQMKHKR